MVAIVILAMIGTIIEFAAFLCEVAAAIYSKGE